MKINAPGWLAVLFSVLSISGCSTIIYHKEAATGKYAEGIYRGTRADAGAICLLVAGPGDAEFGQWSFFFLAALIDLPLSAVADTVYLPYDLVTLGDNSEDLPIRKRLMEQYSPPNRPPAKSQILEDLGQPMACTVLSEANMNVPEKVMTGVRYAPVGSEVLVYKESGRKGGCFTYFIFISPNTQRYIFYCTMIGEIGEDQWPNQPLR